MFAHDRDHLPRQSFQLPRTQIFFAELDVVDAGTRGFGDFGEQRLPAGAFVAAKLAAVGNVIEQTAVSHRFSAYYEELAKRRQSPVAATRSTVASWRFRGRLLRRVAWPVVGRDGTWSVLLSGTRNSLPANRPS